MAKQAVKTSSTFKTKHIKKRPGRHSKKKSTLKTSKNYKKLYRGQGN